MCQFNILILIWLYLHLPFRTIHKAAHTHRNLPDIWPKELDLFQFHSVPVRSYCHLFSLLPPYPQPEKEKIFTVGNPKYYRPKCSPFHALRGTVTVLKPGFLDPLLSSSPSHLFPLGQQRGASGECGFLVVLAQASLAVAVKRGSLQPSTSAIISFLTETVCNGPFSALLFPTKEWVC